MEINRRVDGPATVAPCQRKGQKRKFHQEYSSSAIAMGMDMDADVGHPTLDEILKFQVEVLKSNFSWKEQDRVAARRAAHVLAELAKNEDVVGSIVDAGVVAVLVKHLDEPLAVEGSEKCIEYEVEKECAFALGLLAVKPEHQQLIVDEGALTFLINFLNRHITTPNPRAFITLLRKYADALTNLAHENSSIKTYIRMEGGIPPLVELLEHVDPKVQKSTVGALRTLAFKNDDNKNQITECNALPTLVLMLRHAFPICNGAQPLEVMNSFRLFPLLRGKDLHLS